MTPQEGQLANAVRVRNLEDGLLHSISHTANGRETKTYAAYEAQWM